MAFRRASLHPTTQDRNIGAVIVVDHDGQVAGLITETDFTGIGMVARHDVLKLVAGKLARG